MKMMTLGWLGACETSVFEALAGKKVKSVRMLGCDENLQWSLESDGLHVTMPKQSPDANAVALAIEL